MNWRTILLRQIILLSFAAATVFAQNSLSAIGGFEGALPAYWTMGSQPAGATLSWATDQFRSMGHSLKIVKPGVTTDSASWISTNMCDIWSPNVPKYVDILLGAYVKTSGVNVSPATNDAKWWVAYAFYDTLGVFMGETKLPINQITASSIFFVADTNSAGQSTLERDAYKVIAKFVAGKNATGTVWADDFVFYGRTTWGGQDRNTSVGVSTGWYYWLPPNGGNDGLLANGFENTTVTTEEAHTGTHSLKFSLPAGRSVHDGYVGTIPRPFSDIGSNIGPGDSINISVWIKANNLVPDGATANPGIWSVGITPLFFRNDTVALSRDYYFTFPPGQTSFDWTKYTQGVRIPSNVGATDMEIRLHVYSLMVGQIYFDDLTVEKESLNDVPVIAPIPTEFSLSQNYPNPFNPNTTIKYQLPTRSQVTLAVYNTLGQKVATLVNESEEAGYYDVKLDGSGLASGVYFFRIQAGTFVQTRKLLLLR